MEKITVAQLKKQLKDLGEKVSGTKSVLLERLNNAQQKNATTPSVITVAGETTTIDGLRSLPLPNLTDKGTTVSAVKSPVSDQVKIVPVHESVTRKRLKTIQNEPSVMNIAGKTTVDGLKNQLRAMGAKVSGNKSVLQERVKNWQENNVTRPLFEINVIEEDKENFPTNMKSQPLENLDSKILEWLTPSVIAYYFSERLSTKGHDKGRKLFLCEFLKNISFVAKDNDVFISSVCSAETKKSTDYAVRVHLNCKERTVIKANCECPAGSGKNASCKHVGAVLYGVEYFAVTGRVKQNGACTSQLQQWHMPRQKGRQLEAITVDKLMNVPSKQYEASEAITNFFFNSIIQGLIKMSNQPPKQRIQVPDSLRDVLLEFSIAYLLEQPGDVVDYAVEFFSKLQDNRKTTMVHADEVPSPDESIMSVDEEPLVNRFATRRKSVFAETYDPENDADEDEGAVAIFPKSDEQRSRLIESVRNILLFRSLDKEQMNQVLDAMFERKVTVDETVIRQGDDGDNFYVIESGTYKAYVGENHIHTYNNSGSFGELALLYNMPRAATIKAETVGQLWAMDRQTFRRILLKSAFRKRKMYESLLDTVPMLKTLQSYERLNLADALAPKSFKANERIIKQGDAADGMYFIEDGTVSIRLDQDDGEVEISRLSKGAYFGELALVTHRPRAASAYAVENVKVAFLDVDAFERLLGPCMDIMKRNIGDYEAQLIKIFGSKNNIKDVR